jgi:hypothetical protein
MNRWFVIAISVEYFCASAGYAWKGDPRHALYFALCGAINLNVLFL